MEHYLYSNLGNKSKKREPEYPGLETSPSLKDFINKAQSQSGLNWKIITESEIIKAFCSDLKELLEFEDIDAIIHGLFAVENNLNQVKGEYIESDLDFPSLQGLYQQLSPLLLRSIHERTQKVDNPTLVYQSWMEALRISIEEEIYIWQSQTVG